MRKNKRLQSTRVVRRSGQKRDTQRITLQVKKFKKKLFQITVFLNIITTFALNFTIPPYLLKIYIPNLSNIITS